MYQQYNPTTKYYYQEATWLKETIRPINSAQTRLTLELTPAAMPSFFFFVRVCSMIGCEMKCNHCELIW